jgi:putative hemolysin
MKNALKWASTLFILCTSLNLSAIPNPASVHCAEKGGISRSAKTKGGGSYAICQFSTCDSDKNCQYSECEEWAFFRKECSKGSCEKWLVKEDAEGNIVSKCEKPVLR